MTNIDLITIISAYFNLIPTIYFLIVRNNISIKFKSIFVYLLACIIVETLYVINRFYFNYDTRFLTVSFLFFESTFVFLFYRKYLIKTLINILSFALIIYASMILIELSSQLILDYEIFLGGSRIINFIVLINIILTSFSINLPIWNKTIIFAFLQNTIVNVTIFSFASFFIENKEYLLFFVSINALSNMILYLLLTYSMFLCKKKYLQA